MTEPTQPTPPPILANTAAAEAPTEAGFSVDAGATNLKDAFLGYVARIRNGEVGALPAVAGLVVLLVVFSTTTKIFLTRGNLANLPTQAAPTILIGMGLVFVLLLGEIDLSAGTAAGLASAGMAIAVNFHGNLETRLFRHHGRENRAGGKARHQKQDAGTEDGTDDLIEFEGVHSGSGSSPEGRW